MTVKYVTLIKDYQYNRRKGISRIADVIEDRLACALCVETVSGNYGKVMKHKPFPGQMVWNLS